MSHAPNQASTPTTTAPKPRKPYHTPRMEDYGAVNQLTRSNDVAAGADGFGFASF